MEILFHKKKKEKKKEKKKGNSVQSVAIKEGERDRKHTFEGNKGFRRS